MSFDIGNARMSEKPEYECRGTEFQAHYQLAAMTRAKVGTCQPFCANISVGFQTDGFCARTWRAAVLAPIDR